MKSLSPQKNITDDKDAQGPNLGVRAKFLKGITLKEHPLTNDDVETACSQLDCEAAVVSLKEAEIHRHLYQARIKHTDSKPYTIPFLINVNNAGWISATVEVVPSSTFVEKSKICVSLQGDARILEKNQKVISEVINKAIFYSETVEEKTTVQDETKEPKKEIKHKKQISTKTRQAFSRNFYTIDSIKTNWLGLKASGGRENNLWNSGYYVLLEALKNSKSKLLAKQELSDTLKIRDTVLNLILNSETFSQSEIDNSPWDEDMFCMLDSKPDEPSVKEEKKGKSKDSEKAKASASTQEQNHYRIKDDSLDLYLSTIDSAHTSPLKKSSHKALAQRKKRLEKYRDFFEQLSKHFKEEATTSEIKLKKEYYNGSQDIELAFDQLNREKKIDYGISIVKISSASVLSSNYVIQIDFNEFLKEDEHDPETIKIRLKALVEQLNLARHIEKIRIIDFSRKHLEEINHAFNRLCHIKNIYVTEKSSDGERLAAKNINKQEDADELKLSDWCYIAHRNRHFYNRMIPVSDQSFYQLFSQHDQTASVASLGVDTNSHIESMDPPCHAFELRFIDELLSYLENSKNTLQEKRENRFTNLLIQYPFPVNSDKNYLTQISDHLKNGKYFPFEKIVLRYDNDSDIAFEKLLNFIDMLNRCAYRNQNLSIVIICHLQDTENKQTCFDFSEKRYDQLISLYQEKGITIPLSTHGRKISKSEHMTREEEAKSNKDYPKILKKVDTLENALFENIKNKIAKKNKKITGDEYKEKVESKDSFQKDRLKEVKKDNVDEKDSSDEDDPIRLVKQSYFFIDQYLTVGISTNSTVNQTHQSQQATQVQVQGQIGQSQFFGQQQQYDTSENLSDISELYDRKKFVSSSIYSRYSPAERTKLWNQCFGINDQLPHAIKFVTKAALDKVLAYKAPFLNGIHFKYQDKEQGFKISQHPDQGVILDYDSSFTGEVKTDSSLIPTSQLAHLRNKFYFNSKIMMKNLREKLEQSEFKFNPDFSQSPSSAGESIIFWRFPQAFSNNDMKLEEGQSFIEGIEFKLADNTCVIFTYQEVLDLTNEFKMRATDINKGVVQDFINKGVFCDHIFTRRYEVFQQSVKSSVRLGRELDHQVRLTHLPSINLSYIIDAGRATVRRFWDHMQVFDPVQTKEIKQKYALFFEDDVKSDSKTESKELIDKDSLKFKSKNSIAGLLNVLCLEGCAGIDALLDALNELQKSDPDLCRHFKEYFIDLEYPTIYESDRRYFGFSVSSKTLNYITRLSTLSGAYKAWWKEIVSQQKEIIFNYQELGFSISFEELAEGFFYFIEHLPLGVSLPEHFPFHYDPEHPKNMLVFLSRLLSLLKTMNPAYLADQMQYLDKLCYDQQGIFYASDRNSFFFFHPEMHIDPFDTTYTDDERLFLTITRNKPGYQVSFNDLKKVALPDSKADTSKQAKLSDNYLKILFHRCIGSSRYIHTPYAYYVDLANKVIANFPGKKSSAAPKILALLALTTTGKRGRKVPEAKMIDELLGNIKTHKAADNLLTRLFELVDENTMPTTEELNGLILLLSDADSSTLDSRVALLKPLNKELLTAINIWSKNSSRITSENFFIAFKSLHEHKQKYNTEKKSDKNDRKEPILEEKKADKEKISLAKNPDQLMIFLACVKKDNVSFSIKWNQLKPKLLQLETTPAFLSMVQIFSLIDFKRTPYQQLPSLLQLESLIDEILTSSDGVDVRNLIRCNLPGVYYRVPDKAEVTVTDFNTVAGDGLRILNLEIHDLLDSSEAKIFSFTPFTLDELSNNDINASALAVQSRLDGMREVDEKIKSAFSKKVINAFYRIFIEIGLEKLSRYQALIELRSYWLGNLSDQYQKIGDDFAKIRNYFDQSNQLDETLLSFEKILGRELDDGFFDRIPKINGMALSIDKLIHLFEIVTETNLNYLPDRLVETIFKYREFKSNDDFDLFVFNAKHILNDDSLNLSNRIDLIEILFGLPIPAGVVSKILDFLKRINNASQPIILKCLNLFKLHRDDHTFTNHLIVFLNDLFDCTNHKKLLSVMLPKLMIKQDAHKIVASINGINDRERKKKILNIISYIGVTDIFDKKYEITGEKDNIFNALIELDEVKLNKISKLFDHIPRPGINFLALLYDSEHDIDYFIDRYSVFSQGVRDIETQFDSSMSLTQIDGVKDFSIPNLGAAKQGQSLFYTQRKRLFEDTQYITDVGYSHNLSVDPVDLEFLTISTDDKKTDFQKPVRHLTHEQLDKLTKAYVNFYKKESSSLSPVQARRIKLEFLALLRETMYRTTGIFPNITQIISVLNMMSSNHDMICEIPTGQGKSITICLLTAMQLLTSNRNIVCTTTNMELAQRDAERFSDFYTMCGFSVAVIDKNSKKSEPADINYSTMSEFSLFEQSVSPEKPLPINLVMDEVDATVTDSMEHRLVKIIESLNGGGSDKFSMCYRLIYDFVQTAEFKEKVGRRKDISNLLKYYSLQASRGFSIIQDMVSALSPDSREWVANKFSNLSPDNLRSLDIWIDAAFIASNLKQGVHFFLEEKIMVIDGREKIMTVAVVKQHDRLVPDAAYKDGVQQFLHLRLNDERSRGQLYQLDAVGNKVPVQYPFPILPEGTELSVSNSKEQWDKVKRTGGRVIGLTGTSGGPQDWAYYKSLSPGLILHSIPSHQTNQRIIHLPVITSPFFASDNAAIRATHYQKIASYVNACRRAGRPVLICCGSIAETEDLGQYLSEQRLVGSGKIQIFNGEANGGEGRRLTEKEVIDNAGKDGTITITTDLLGRGSDIVALHSKGLYVISTDIKPVRDTNQLSGRTARQGCEGEFIQILSSAKIKEYRERFGLPSNLSDSQCIPLIQEKMDAQNYAQLYKNNAYGDFRKLCLEQLSKLRENIKIEFNKEEKKATLDISNDLDQWKQLEAKCHIIWISFLREAEIVWKTLNDKASSTCERSVGTELSQAKIQELFAELIVKMQPKWAEAINQMIDVAEPYYAKNGSKLILNMTDYSIKIVKQKESKNTFLEDDEYIADISDRPLTLQDTNEEAIYLKITESCDEKQKNRVLFVELSKIYEILFQKPYDKQLRQALTDLEENVNTLLSKVMPELFNRHHLEFKQGSYSVKNRKLYQDIYRIISQYGNDGYKDLVYQLSDDFLRAVRNDPDYHLAAAQFINIIQWRTSSVVDDTRDRKGEGDERKTKVSQRSDLAEISVEAGERKKLIEPIAPDELKAQKVDEAKESQVVQDMASYFHTTFATKYSSICRFFSSRGDSFTEIDKPSNKTGVEQHLHRLSVVNARSSYEAKQDVTVDQQALIFYRGSSQFQKAALKLRDQILLCVLSSNLVTKDHIDKIMIDEFQTLASLVKNFSARLQLPAYKTKTPVGCLLAEIRGDKIWCQDHDELLLNPERTEQFAHLQQVFDQLRNYRQRWLNLESSSKEKSCYSVLENLLYRMNTLLSFQKKLEKRGENLTERVITTSENNLRQRVRVAMQTLVQSPVGKRNSVLSRLSTVPNGSNKELYQAALYQIILCARQQYGDEHLISIDQSSFDTGLAELTVKLKIEKSTDKEESKSRSAKFSARAPSQYVTLKIPGLRPSSSSVTCHLGKTSHAVTRNEAST